MTILFWRARRRTGKALARYSRIVDLEAEQASLSATNCRLNEEIGGLKQRTEDERAKAAKFYQETQAEIVSSGAKEKAKLKAEYETALSHYQELQKEIAVAEDSLEDISFGLYKPHFTFQTPEEYKAKLELLRTQQTGIVREGRATQCPIEWTVNNSKVEGKRMIRLHSKLILRAFNGECAAAIANVSWNNAQRMEERIRKAFADINKLGAVENITVTELYFMLKIEEFQMTREFEQKRYEAREDQRRIREQIREEERTKKEIERTLEAAVSEEERYSAAIATARDQATRSMGAQLERLTEQITKFEAKLDEARRKKERAISRAQITKSGFVYVISNIGSFGNNVFKVGMTRRLEPQDRIYELSGASVPFPYDLHAMLYSDNAPALEHEIHCLLKDRRLNRANSRREFFHDVELREIQEFVVAKGLSAQFLQIPEAREYRQSLAMRQQGQNVTLAPAERFPQQLFEAD